MTVRFIDHQGFAGAFTLGGVQAGMKLVAKIEGPGAFGARNCEVNRHLLGDDWELQEGVAETWDATIPADVILSNPPCSAFSSLSWGVNRKSYGMASQINQCMWNMIGYAGSMAIPPKVVVMESVQAAAVNGMPLMRGLRAKLEELTGHQYHLYHVLQNNGALGGCSVRRRYFMVLSRVPFGVEMPNYGPPATLRNAIGDLQKLDPHTMAPQKYRGGQSSWIMSQDMMNTDELTVDGHATAPHETPGVRRLIDLMEAGAWPQNRCLVWALRAYYEKHGRLPDSWHFKRQSGAWADEALIAKNMEMGFTRPKRWVYDLPARVIIGGAMYLVVHPEQDRLLTHRECARIMGFPDTWKIAPLDGIRGLEQTHGKGVSVSAGRWIARWAKSAVEGKPGSVVGEPVTSSYRLAPHGNEDRETVIDVSSLPKTIYPVKLVNGVVTPSVVEELAA